METPTDVQSVQRIIGMVKYLSKFLSNLSELCQPLRKLTHKDVGWQWTQEQEDALIPVSQNGCYTSPSPQVFQPTSSNWRTGWCLSKWPRVCSNARGSASYICKSRTHPSRAEIFSDWERTSGSSFWARTQSSLHVWKTSDFVDRPQTSDINLQEASCFSTKASPEATASTPAVWCWLEVQTWFWNVLSWHLIKSFFKERHSV